MWYIFAFPRATGGLLGLLFLGMLWGLISGIAQAVLAWLGW
jgi:hypothetical protein